MTEKKDVVLPSYRKKPRRLAENMLEALGEGEPLNPLLQAVLKNDALRLEIRDRRFNIYYRGGNLLLVDGRKQPWALRFDGRYFNSRNLPKLPDKFSGPADIQAWVEAFPALRAGMDEWWKGNRREERDHCQGIAAANAARKGLPPADYLVLDLEYQWAQRRFDMMAARRSPCAADPGGWTRPALVFIEVKSNLGACKEKSGLKEHARDFRDIVTSEKGRHAGGIRKEFEGVAAQKKKLGLLDSALPFQGFSDAPPELLIVLDGITTKNLIEKANQEIRAVADVAAVLGDFGCIHFLELASPQEPMKSANLIPPERLI